MTLDIPAGDFAAYIFDCDGTLADTMPLHYRAWSRVVAEHGGSFPEELFYQLGGRPTEQIFAVLRDQHGLRIDDIARGTELKERYFLDMIHEVRPVGAVVDIAARSFGRLPLAVASGGVRSSVHVTLAALGVRHLFDAVVCAEDYARSKPFPDPFLEAARRLHVPAERCLVFEDSPVGVQAAEAAGMRWVLVPR
ncbi:MAG: HAD family hydrolase [Steroidobacterales bacterium]